MTLRNPPRFAACCLLLLAALGCGGGASSPSEPAPESLTLVRVDPPKTVLLRRGARVDFAAALHFDVTPASQGTLTVSAWSDGVALAPAQGVPYTLSRNSGSVSLAFSFTVPRGAHGLSLRFSLRPDAPAARAGGALVIVDYSAGS